MRYVVLVLFVLVCSVGFAALPPDAQRVREMRQILETPMLTEKVPGVIEGIFYQPNHRYQIITNLSVVEVVVHYLPMDRDRVGPVEFELEFKSPTRRSQLQ